jgi:ATP-dependent helicase/nuclease subunit B
MDEFATGELRIVDYKTGEGKLKSHQTKTYKPQLFLEAWIARQGGFGGLPKAVARELMYIRLSGGEPAGQINTGPVSKKNKIVVEDEVKVAEEGVKKLIAAYLDAAQPYPAKPGQETWDRKGDYDHLSRWREWAMGSDANTTDGDSE